MRLILAEPLAISKYYTGLLMGKSIEYYPIDFSLISLPFALVKGKKQNTRPDP